MLISVVDILLVFPLVFSPIAGNGYDTVYVLQIKPPFVLIVWFSISEEEIVKSDRKASRDS